MNITYSLNDISRVAKDLIESKTSNNIIFQAPMGAGKTTLIKAICEQMGVEDEVTSPTFSLVNEYQSKNGDRIYHFDLYRINDAYELQEIGIEDYFTENAICLIEWPEHVIDLLENYNTVSIEVVNDTERRLTLK